MENRLYQRNKKATDPEYVRKLNESARRRHATRRAEDPEYDAQCREYSKAQYIRSKEAGALLPYKERCQRRIEKYGYDKVKEYSMKYYIHRCETDPNYRAKQIERNEELYRERKIR